MTKVPQAVGLENILPIVKIPWGHNILIITKIKKIISSKKYRKH
jgi:hypothetical protein